MCGVAGALSPQPLLPGQLQTLRAINGRMFHRGPDAEGEYAEGHAALAMRRLKIIDLATGDQPIFNETRDVVVVANGEIYNHKQLRSQLIARGHRFTTKSDVETIVHLYEEKGEGLLEDLRGMFALAIWDKKKRKLLLARDRFGEKPLYLHRDGSGTLWFASELTALAPAVEAPAFSARAAYLFMIYQYIPEPLTLLENVTLLPAGHMLAVTPENTSATSREYWDFAKRPAIVADGAAEMVAEVFGQSCKLMGTADVPVAISLSGGVDSSLVAAFVAGHYPGQIGAFTVGYPGSVATDERKIAKKLAQTLDLPFTEVIIDTAQMVADFPEIVADMAGAPVADIAAPGYWAVARAARAAGYPALMSGIGGDEMFWGYDWTRSLAAALEEDPSGAPKPPPPPGPWRRTMDWLTGAQPPSPVRRDHLYADIAAFREYDGMIRKLSHNTKGGDWAGEWETPARFRPNPVMDLEICRALNQTWLSANCLALSDRMSMAHSVELRLPMLDVDLADAVAGLRAGGLKDWKKGGKALLLESMGSKLPPEVVNRPKQGFTPPAKQWYEGVVTAYGPMLGGGYLVKSGFLDPDRVEAFMRKGDLFMRYKLTLLEMMVSIVFEGKAPGSILHPGAVDGKNG